MIYGKDCWISSACKKRDTCEHGESQYCPRLFRLTELYSHSMLTEKQWQPTVLYPDNIEQEIAAFETLNKIKNDIEAFVISGSSLYLYSSFAGNGKTSWAVKLMQAYFGAIWHKTIECSAIFINVPRFMMELKSSISSPSKYIEDIKSKIYDVPLVVWDDIGSKVGSEYEIETLLSYINARIDLGRANIYTSNITPEELTDVLGGRLSSRIVSMSTCVKLVGRDKRGL